MPNVGIPDLPPVSTLTGTELIPLDQGGTTKKATGADLGKLSRGSGLLSARPSAASVGAGFTYFATDDSSGTLYVSNGSTWDQAAPSMDLSNAGSRLAYVRVTTNCSAVAINSAIPTTFRIPEITTGSFTMPSTPVWAECSGLVMSGASSGDFTVCGIYYSTDSGSTWNFVSSTGSYRTAAGFEGSTGSWGGFVLASAGATVILGIRLSRSDTNKTITVLTGAIASTLHAVAM